MFRTNLSLLSDTFLSFMKWKLIHLPSVHILTYWLTDHLSALCTSIPFEACHRVPGLFNGKGGGWGVFLATKLQKRSYYYLLFLPKTKIAHSRSKCLIHNLYIFYKFNNILLIAIHKPPPTNKHTRTNKTINLK